jgi:multiple sugar transport system ATP-binding protein
MTLGDRVAVLRDGRLEQVAAPMELYRRPATRFVASFIGSPPMNFFECRLTRASDLVELDDAGAGVHLSLGSSAALELHAASHSVTVGIRPHDIERVTAGEPAAFRGVVDLVEPRGNDVVVSARPAVDLPPADRRALVAVLPAESAIREGQPFAARFPTDRLRFFDPESGRRLG